MPDKNCQSAATRLLLDGEAAENEALAQSVDAARAGAARCADDVRG